MATLSLFRTCALGTPALGVSLIGEAFLAMEFFLGAFPPLGVPEETRAKPLSPKLFSLISSGFFLFFCQFILLYKNVSSLSLKITSI